MQSSDIKNKSTYKQIFADHWTEFIRHYPWYDTEHINNLVESMLNCGNPKYMGYAEYRCTGCGLGFKLVSLSCKCYLCLSCGKVHTDNWVSQVCGSLFDCMCYRHIVLTMPCFMSELFSHKLCLLSALPRCGSNCLKDFYSRIKRKDLIPGFIVVLQTHGRNGSYNVHLHIIATSGGLDEKNKWNEITYFPYKLLHQMWQDYLLSMLEAELGDLAELYVATCRKDYPNGFVAYVDTKNPLNDCAALATYLAKYVVAPPISVRRIKGYDGHHVTYVYKSHKTDRIETEKVDVFTFIERMVRHILPKGFKRIRYFGLHLTSKVKKFRALILDALRRSGKIVKNTVKIIQKLNYRQRYKGASGIDPFICPYCGSEMELWEMYHPDYGTFYEGYDDYSEIYDAKKEEVKDREIKFSNIEQMLLPF